MEQTLGKLHSGTTLNAWNQNPALRERRAASKQAQKPSTQGKHFVLSSKFNQAWTAGPIQGLFSLSQITQLAQPAAAWLDFKQSQKNSWFRGLPAAKKIHPVAEISSCYGNRALKGPALLQNSFGIPKLEFHSSLPSLLLHNSTSGRFQPSFAASGWFWVQEPG